MSTVLEKPKTAKEIQRERANRLCLVIHGADTPAEACIDGRGIVIPPNQVFEVPSITCTDHNNNGPYEYTIPPFDVMTELLRQCWAWGLVEVPVIKEKGKFGVNHTFNAETAHALAKKAQLEAEEKIVATYVRDQRELMSQAKPARPPNEMTHRIIQRRGIDLKRDYNLEPIGYGQVAQAAGRDEEFQALREQNSAQSKQIADLLERFNKLASQLGEDDKKKTK